MSIEQYQGVLEKVSSWMVEDPVASKRLYLRVMDKKDFPAFVKIYGDPAVTLPASRKVYGNIDDLAKIFVFLLHSAGFPTHFAICRKEDDEMIGLFDFELHPVCHEQELEGMQGISLSFMINRDNQKKGYMSELLECVLDYYLVRHDLDFVNSGYIQGNAGSKRLHEHSSMQYLKTMDFIGEDCQTVEFIAFGKDRRHVEHEVS